MLWPKLKKMYFLYVNNWLNNEFDLIRKKNSDQKPDRSIQWKHKFYYLIVQIFDKSIWPRAVVCFIKSTAHSGAIKMPHSLCNYFDFFLLNQFMAHIKRKKEVFSLIFSPQFSEHKIQRFLLEQFIFGFMIHFLSWATNIISTNNICFVLNSFYFALIRRVLFTFHLNFSFTGTGMLLFVRLLSRRLTLAYKSIFGFKYPTASPQTLRCFK